MEITGRSSQPVITAERAGGLGPAGDLRRAHLRAVHERGGRHHQPGRRPARELRDAPAHEPALAGPVEVLQRRRSRSGQSSASRARCSAASGVGDVYVGVSGDVNARTSWTYRQRLPGPRPRHQPARDHQPVRARRRGRVPRQPLHLRDHRADAAARVLAQTPGRQSRHGGFQRQPQGALGVLTVRDVRSRERRAGFGVEWHGAPGGRRDGRDGKDG